MGKLDDVMRTMGGNISASLGAGQPARSFPPHLNPAEARPTPAGKEGTARMKNALDIPTDKLQPDPDQPRDDFDPEAIARLAESLKTRGQLQPIRVRWSEGASAYLIVTGERRWRAAVLAALPTMAAVVHDGTPTPGELLAMQVVENALREDLKPVEQARAFKALMDLNGWSGVRIAQELHITNSMVSQALALLDLPVDVQAKVDAGEVAARTGYELSKLGDADAVRELADQAAAGNLPLGQATAVVKARRLGKAGAAPGGRREFRYPDGAKVAITLPPGMEGDAAYLDMIQRAAKELRAGLKQAGTGRAGEAA